MARHSRRAATWSRTRENTRVSNRLPASYAAELSNERLTWGGTARPSTLTSTRHIDRRLVRFPDRIPYPVEIHRWCSEAATRQRLIISCRSGAKQRFQMVAISGLFPRIRQSDRINAVTTARTEINVNDDGDASDKLISWIESWVKRLRSVSWWIIGWTMSTFCTSNYFLYFLFDIFFSSNFLEKAIEMI